MPNAGELATASRSPVATSTATRAEGTALLPARAASAADCVLGSSVKVIGAPLTAGFSNSDAPGLSLAVTFTPGMPPSAASYCPCSPLSPA
jgi:hypothetical protein